MLEHTDTLVGRVHRFSVLKEGVRVRVAAAAAAAAGHL
jgi:hypothetical protein